MPQVLGSWTPVKPGPDRGVVVRVVLQPLNEPSRFVIGGGEGAPLQERHDLSELRQRHQRQAKVPGQLVATAKTKLHFQRAQIKSQTDKRQKQTHTSGQVA